MRAILCGGVVAKKPSPEHPLLLTPSAYASPRLESATLRLRKESSMPGYQFERESRTPFSEVYTLQADGSDVGRVDIHFTPSGTVQATLCVPAELDDDGVEELIGEIDERLVLTADVYRDDFIVTVWR